MCHSFIRTTAAAPSSLHTRSLDQSNAISLFLQKTNFQKQHYPSSRLVYDVDFMNIVLLLDGFCIYAYSKINALLPYVVN